MLRLSSYQLKEDVGGGINVLAMLKVEMRENMGETKYDISEESKNVAENYYRYYRKFALSGIIGLHEGAVDRIMPKEGKTGPSLAFHIRLAQENYQEELQELINGIRSGTVPDRWLITPDAEPENLADILKGNGFKNLSENASEPEPGMLLYAADFCPYPADKPSVRCREVRTKEDFEIWVDVVNTALHGWRMIDAGHYAVWLAQKDMRFYLAETDGMPAATAATIQSGSTASLEFISTLKEYRRRKAAITLSSKALEDLFADGVETVTLSGASEAVPLYKKLGFHECFHNIIMLYESGGI